MDPGLKQQVGILAKGLKPTDPRMAVLANAFPEMIPPAAA
jgi:hypothetical protein